MQKKVSKGHYRVVFGKRDYEVEQKSNRRWAVYTIADGARRFAMDFRRKCEAVMYCGNHAEACCD